MRTETVRRTEIEQRIESARRNLTDSIDELDARIRGGLDLAKIAAGHTPELMVAGATLGFLVGFGVPRALVRTVQIGVPLLLAVEVLRAARRARAVAHRTPRT